MKSLPFTEAIRKAKLEVLQGQGEAQTRRLMIPQPPQGYAYKGFSPNPLLHKNADWLWMNGYACWRPNKLRHHEGEIAYVPEAWCIGSYERWRYVEVVFKAGGAIRVDWNSWMEDNTSYARSNVIEEKWRSPRFMPAWAARWFVQFTAPPVPQRVQEITEDDAMAEGCIADFEYLVVHDQEEFRGAYAREYYAKMWDAAYPRHPFSSNPWEITYRFHLTERPEGL